MQAKPAAMSSPNAGESAGANVYAQIKHGIMSNEFVAGVQIRESELADRFGTSRTPVREAMIRLEADGLVEVLPRRGARVLPVRGPDMREIYDILIALETLAAEQLAARSVEASEFEQLQTAVDLMEAAFAKNDLARWAEGDNKFHRALLKMHGNARLIAITDTLYSQAHRTQMVTLRMRQDMGTSNIEHRKILDCLIKSDAGGARRAMAAHRQRGGDEILEILDSYGLPPL